MTRNKTQVGTWLAVGAMLLGVGLAVWPSIARADDDGVLVRMRVLDVASEAPIQTAVVRHPQEQVRHPVNVQTGVWEDSVLYMPDGSELACEHRLPQEHPMELA